MEPRVHDSFAAALRDPALAVPDGLTSGGSAAHAPRGFAVYRNNVTVSLVDALADRFPVCGQLVGDDFFRAMARAFVAVSPPASPLMMTYGDGFADFIEAFPPAGELPYLADVARLEAARTRAYHAADSTPLDADAFSGFDGAALAACRVVLHPSVEILRAAFAAATIWAVHQGDALPGDIDPTGAEDILIARSDMEVELRLLPPGAAVFITALMNGTSLAEAADAAGADDPAFDPGETLALVIAARIVTAILPAD